MTLVASLLAAVAVVLAVPARGSARARLGSARPAPGRSRAWLRRAGPLGVVAAGAMLVSLPGAVAVGLVLAVAGLGFAADRRSRVRPAGALPLVYELAAACLDAGAGLADAVEAAAVAASPRECDVLRRTAAALRRGAGPAAWARCVDVPALEPLARAGARREHSGSALSGELRAIAQQTRATTNASRRQRAERAAVWLVLPLGLCLLPAFLLLTVVPLVAALLPALA